MQATRLGEQHEQDARVNRQEVARLEERIATLTAESDMVQSMFLLNLHSAETCEGQPCDSLHAANTREGRLCDTLRSNGTLLSEVQAALRMAEDTGRAQQQSLTLELETCAMQREHWKTMAEQAEMRVVAADRSMLDLRKELTVVFRNAREAKEQLESQGVVIGERDATIRSLNRELVEVWGQLRDAEDEIDSLRSDLERTDAWEPLDAVNVLQFNDGTPPGLEWCGSLTKDEPKIPTLATQLRPRFPDLSIVELSCDDPTSIQPAATLPNDPLACSTTPVIRSAPLDDPFVVDSLLKHRPAPNPTSAVLGLAESPATSVSHLGRTEMINDLQEQFAQEQLARVDAEYQLTLQQLKLLATEAVVVVQQCQLSEESAKNASLRKEIHDLKVEHGAMTARIAQSEASLAQCQTARTAATKATGDARIELVKVKETLSVLTMEAGGLKKEVDELHNLKFEHGAMTARVAHLKASLAESQMGRMVATKVADDTHTELVKVKETLSMLTKEANGLRKKTHKLKKEAGGLKKERHALDMRSSQAMLLSSALQKRVQDLEQRAANVSNTPLDGLFEPFIPFFVGLT